MLKRSPLAHKQLPKDGKGRRCCRSRVAKSQESYVVALGWSRYETYLGFPEPASGATPDLGVGRCWVARLGPCGPPPLLHGLPSALRPQVLALERAQPPLVCQVMMPWSRPGGEGWRASRNSRDAMLGRPPFNMQATHKARWQSSKPVGEPPPEEPAG